MLSITKMISKYNHYKHNDIKYIVLHDTGNYKDTAKIFIKDIVNFMAYVLKLHGFKCALKQTFWNIQTHLLLH